MRLQEPEQFPNLTSQEAWTTLSGTWWDWWAVLCRSRDSGGSLPIWDIYDFMIWYQSSSQQFAGLPKELHF